MKIRISSGDVFGGITAGIVALPLALAFGVHSGLGPEAGLYGAIAIGFFASLFGGTAVQISGPTGPMTVVCASIASLYLIGDTIDIGMGIILWTFIFAGIFQILFGILGIGKYIKFIPYPVLSGFMTGIGVIIIILQIMPLFGLESPKNIVDVFPAIYKNITSINVFSLISGICTILLIYLIPLITKKIPSTLIALVLVTVLTVVLSWDLPTIGKIIAGLPSIKINSLLQFNLSDLSLIIIPAVTLAGLGSLDTLLTSVVADNITKTKHNSKKELIGQGIGNIIAALIGGIPGAGATMRTVVNVKSGGKTRLSGIIHVLVLLIILLGASRYVAYIPLSVLSGILITVGFSIVDKKGLLDIKHIPVSDAIIMVLVLILTVFVDLLQAVGIGMVLSSIVFMKRASDLIESGTAASAIKISDRENPWEDETSINKAIRDNVYIVRLDGPLFFGSVNGFRSMIASIPDNVKIVVIRMRKVPFLDQSGLYAIESALNDLCKKKIKIAITMVQHQPIYMLKRIKVIPNLISEKFVFDTFEDCAKWIDNETH